MTQLTLLSSHALAYRLFTRLEVSYGLCRPTRLRSAESHSAQSDRLNLDDPSPIFRLQRLVCLFPDQTAATGINDKIRELQTGMSALIGNLSAISSFACAHVIWITGICVVGQ